MPNHCEGDLTITGDKHRIAQFVEFARFKKEGLCADKFIPYPEKFKKADEKRQEWEELPFDEQKKTPCPKDGFNSGGYEWCIQNWGTKWGIYEDEIEYSNGEPDAVYHFKTAWSPASKIIEAMAKMFPDLKFAYYYYECGAGYQGEEHYAEGKLVKNKTLDYHGNRGG